MTRMSALFACDTLQTQGQKKRGSDVYSVSSELAVPAPQGQPSTFAKNVTVMNPYVTHADPGIQSHTQIHKVLSVNLNCSQNSCCVVDIQFSFMYGRQICIHLSFKM